MDVNSSSEDEIDLKPETLAILNEFLEQKVQLELDGALDENWQLSQFWYTEETCGRIVEECLQALDNGHSRIACISCPSLIQTFKEKQQQYSEKSFTIKLFEFDRRFQQRYDDIFIFYDYREPLNVPSDCAHSFDYIIVDPPFLSEECFVKVAQTVRLLQRKSDCKLLFCTGTIMEELLRRLLKLEKTQFRPAHRNNLANDFSSFTNYKPKTL